MEWPSFWEHFEVAVHKTDIDEIGETASVIKGLALMSVHHATAIELLQKCYGHKDLFVVSHVQALLIIEALCNADVAKL